MLPPLAALTLVLFLGIGIGLFLARQAGSPTSKPARLTAIARPVPPLQGPARPDSDRPAKTPPVPGAREVFVEVLDSSGQPADAAAVFAIPVDEQGRPVSGPGQLDPVGELGVLHGALPFPRDVVEGTASVEQNFGQNLDQNLGQNLGARGIRAVTDVRGIARIPFVPPGRVQLVASRDGLLATAEILLTSRRGNEKDFETGPRVVLRLLPTSASLATPAGSDTFPEGSPAELADPDPGEPRAPLTGVVLDDRAFGLPGVRVEVKAGRRQLVALTDARGQFALSGLSGAAATLSIQHPGFAPLIQAVPATLARLRLQLLPGAGIEGEVRDRRLGTPPPRVRLTLTPSGAHGPPVVIHVARDGRFSRSGLPTGDATLLVQAPGYAPLRRAVQLLAADRPGGISLRDVRLEPSQAGAVAVRVRDRSGAPASVRVHVLDESGSEIGQGTANARGEFRLGSLPTGKISVLATSLDGATASDSADIREGGEVRVDLDLK